MNNAPVGTYGYDANGNRSSLTLANGVVTSYAYNKANWLTELTNAKGGATLSSYAYSYYADGNQRTKTDNNNRVSTYIYDGVGRLKSEAESSGLGLAYTYDRRGNRKTLTATGAQTYGVAYDYDANNRLVTETKTVGADAVTTAYDYDANGNQKSWMRETLSPVGQTSGALSLGDCEAALYEYDAFNRMTLAYVDGVTTSYAYRVDGLRNSKRTSVATLTHLWDGSNIAADMSGSTLLASYVRGANLLRSDAPASQSYYLYNGHGDVTGLANASGALTWAYDYDAFGVEREIVGQNPSTDANPFRYSGEYFDVETDAYYLRARYYKPGIGRFLTEDQIRSGLNWYTYCGNSPILFFDPSGLAEVALRAYAESFGATVGWDEKTGYASVTYDGKTMYIKSDINNNKNGKIYVDDSLLNNAFNWSYYQVSIGPLLYSVKEVPDKKTTTLTAGPLKSVETTELWYTSGSMRAQGNPESNTGISGVFGKASVINTTKTLTIGNKAFSLGLTTVSDMLTGSVGSGVYLSDEGVSLGGQGQLALLTIRKGIIVSTQYGSGELGGNVTIGGVGVKFTVNNGFQPDWGIGYGPYWRITPKK